MTIQANGFGDFVPLRVSSKRQGALADASSSEDDYRKDGYDEEEAQKAYLVDKFATKNKEFDAIISKVGVRVVSSCFTSTNLHYTRTRKMLMRGST